MRRKNRKQKEQTFVYLFSLYRYIVSSFFFAIAILFHRYTSSYLNVYAYQIWNQRERERERESCKSMRFSQSMA
jgi:hypothetical protein